MDKLTLFTFIGETVTNATDAFVTPVASELIFKLQMLALTCTTLYIVLTGYAIASGSVEAPLQSFLKQCIKIAIISFFALNVDGYQNNIVALFNNLETGLSEALNSDAASPTASIYETLDNMLNNGFNLAATCLQRADEAGWNIGAALSWWTTAAFISIGTLVFAIIGGVNIIIAKFSLAIMFALGPLFVLALLFPITAKFFDGWIGQVLSYIFTIVILALIMTFGVVAFDHFIGKTNLEGDGSHNPFMAGLQILGLTLALGRIAMYASEMASGLAGGVAMSALSLQQIISPGKSALKSINASSSRLDPRTGHQTTSSRLEHLAMGRSFVARSPAYRQATMERMRSAWQHPGGGKIKKQ